MSYPIETIRHSLAHVMAAAVKKLHPDVKFAGGPAIENGFYYDFDTEYRFSEADFDKIGLKGSPTQVKKAYKPVVERNTVLLESKDINDYAGLIIEKIMQCRNNND